MIKYKVVRDWDMERFIEQVNHLLSEGWQLQGGVSTNIQENGNERFLQAMTRRLS